MAKPSYRLTLQNEMDPNRFYDELTSRNFHFVSPQLQSQVRKVKILIAGCGSSGGACIEPLARVGVGHFYLADNGRYELNNLNRQHARIENLDENKAVFHSNEVRSINPFAQVRVFDQGVTRDNVEEMASWPDLVFDGVDVTTPDGIRAKVYLHKACHKYKKPVLSALDLGYLQWGVSFDYRNPLQLALNGRSEEILNCDHPISALLKIFPLSVFPSHCIELLADIYENKVNFASQMGCTSDALSALIVPAMLKFLQTGELLPEWKLDLTSYRYTKMERLRFWLRAQQLKWKIRRYIRATR